MALATEEKTDTRQPFELSEDNTARFKDLGLQENLGQMSDEGYTIIRDIANDDFTARLRETCKKMAQDTEGPAKGHSAALLLGRDPIYEEVVLNPKIQALVEVMCGKGAMLSQLIASIRSKGAPAIGLHADQNWMPAPFPKHNYLLTMCWAMDEFSEDSGATKVIPKSHLRRRHPNPKEIGDQEGAIATECPSNSLVCWDGSIWHANYPRKLEGERVVLHITFSRMALRPVENYDHLDTDWLKGKPKELGVMLGREDFLGSTTIARGSADYMKIPKTFAWAKT